MVRASEQLSSHKSMEAGMETLVESLGWLWPFVFWEPRLQGVMKTSGIGLRTWLSRDNVLSYLSGPGSLAAWEIKTSSTSRSHLNATS